MSNITSNLSGSQIQTLTGTDGGDTLKGSAGCDSISGGGGDDSLNGAGGGDTIDGGAGNDLISGGHGGDLLIGGLGDDTFMISGRVTDAVGSLDRIADFTHGEDRLGLGNRVSLAGHSLASGTEATYADAFAAAKLLIASNAADIVTMQVGADVVVFADSSLHNHLDAAVVLVGKTLADVSSWDVF